MNFFRLSVTLQNKRIDKNPVFFMEYGIFLFLISWTDIIEKEKISYETKLECYT